MHHSIRMFSVNTDFVLIEINFKKLCKVRSPQTKGTDENANKFLNWLKAYDDELESEMELIDIIENVITSQANTQINSRTKLPPLTFFEKKK